MELTQEMIIAGAAALAGCIAWLGRNQVASQRRCEKEGQECRRKQDELDAFIRDTLVGMVKEYAASSAESAVELKRARRVIDREEKRHGTDSDQTPIVPARTHG